MLNATAEFCRQVGEEEEERGRDEIHSGSHASCNMRCMYCGLSNGVFSLVPRRSRPPGERTSGVLSELSCHRPHNC